ncbi:hypothetical protein GDO81_000535 [Engystomops pustulosus]|uniref:Uncharacterized protein n=1 Tax=Engystomops pustulosus TaxID=76066 RepID=A0AAV7D513_ENGPU|nr:hypothetical protein GDO81_000535 [Engystomops pustulosus]
MLLAHPLPALCDAPERPSHHGCSAEPPLCVCGGPAPVCVTLLSRCSPHNSGISLCVWPAAPLRGFPLTLSSPPGRSSPPGTQREPGARLRPGTWRPMWIIVSDKR